MSPTQQPFDFTPGLTDEYRGFEDILLATIRNGGVKQGAIASKCDISPSEFSKSINRYEDRRPDWAWLTNILDETGDYRPIYWLMERYLQSPESREQRALDLLARLLPVVQDAMQTIKTAQKR